MLGTSEKKPQCFTERFAHGEQGIHTIKRNRFTIKQLVGSVQATHDGQTEDDGTRWKQPGKMYTFYKTLDMTRESIQKI